MDLIIRAYNDGVAFRYEFPEKEGTFVIKDELTAYSIPDSTKRWLEKFNTANEGLYSMMKDGDTTGAIRHYSIRPTTCWYLPHEADINRSCCGTKLTNYAEKTSRLTFAANGTEGKRRNTKHNASWKSYGGNYYWNLADIVESTLVDDVSTPSVVAKTDWIQPGVASWNYWSDNHGTRSYKTVCAFADLAAAMDWPYTLLDWEWDAMAMAETWKMH
jgi:hypothetical protein